MPPAITEPHLNSYIRRPYALVAPPVRPSIKISTRGGSVYKIHWIMMRSPLTWRHKIRRLTPPARAVSAVGPGAFLMMERLAMVASMITYDRSKPPRSTRPPLPIRPDTTLAGVSTAVRVPPRAVTAAKRTQRLVLSNDPTTMRPKLWIVAR